jgi:hypothetical protein
MDYNTLRFLCRITAKSLPFGDVHFAGEQFRCSLNGNGGYGLVRNAGTDWSGSAATCPARAAVIKRVAGVADNKLRTE